MHRIDVHTHFHCLDFFKHLYGRSAIPRTYRDGGMYFLQCAPGFNVPALPVLVDVDEKLRDMERLHVDVAMLSHGLVLGPDVLGGAEADEWAMRINDDLARIIETNPRAFRGLGTLGFGDTRRTIAEVDRCLDELGLSGFQLFSNVARLGLWAPAFRPVLRHLAERGAAVHLHPAIPVNAVGMDTASHYLGLGVPSDSSLSVLHLIYSGFFDEAPTFKLIVAHAGGVLPYLKGRLEGYSVRSALIPTPPKMAHPMGYYLERLHVDTVCYHREALECCYKVLGADHLLYGTDHPFGDYPVATELVEQLDCSTAERELIYHGNAERLFSLTRQPAVSYGA